jgi:hypothetical protein
MWPLRERVPPSNAGNRNGNADADRVLPSSIFNAQTIIDEVRCYNGDSKHRNHNQKSYRDAHNVHAASAFLFQTESLPAFRFRCNRDALGGASALLELRRDFPVQRRLDVAQQPIGVDAIHHAMIE